MQEHANFAKEFGLQVPAYILGTVLGQERNALRNIRPELMLCRKLKIPQQPKVKTWPPVCKLQLDKINIGSIGKNQYVKSPD